MRDATTSRVTLLIGITLLLVAAGLAWLRTGGLSWLAAAVGAGAGPAGVAGAGGPGGESGLAGTGPGGPGEESGLAGRGGGGPGAGAAAPAADAVLAIGRDLYGSECAFCHGPDPADRLDVADEVAVLHRSPEGPVYLVDLLLAGLDGEASGEPPHPPFDSLGDAEIAALLRYLLVTSATGDPSGEAPFVGAATVAERRRQVPSTEEVSARRARVVSGR